MEYSIEHLLNEIRTINESYERLAKLSGEHFNIFNVLGMTTNEVYCHSAFITELLNPKGSHDQGNVFLNVTKTVYNAIKIEELWKQCQSPPRIQIA